MFNFIFLIFFTESILTKSCRCVAVIKLVLNLDNIESFNIFIIVDTLTNIFLKIFSILR
jgi:hypothetical protein